jgi:transposase InsO family protein
MSHQTGWREIIHPNVTEHPPAHWTTRQIAQAFPLDIELRYLLRDGDAIYGTRVRRRIASLGINHVVTAPASPWQGAYVERMIGTVRR